MRSNAGVVKKRFKCFAPTWMYLQRHAHPAHALPCSPARDMSTIETAPAHRLQVTVADYDEKRPGVPFSVTYQRSGVFSAQSRGHHLELLKNLQGIVPEARILVGHGQMKADELEEVMTTFINGEADVLLSTTIIESGIDIPNANTITDRADRFGLSDLYQLRGRGRNKHQGTLACGCRYAALLADVCRISAIKQQFARQRIQNRHARFGDPQ